jgi:hypothetical protein
VARAGDGVTAPDALGRELVVDGVFPADVSGREVRGEITDSVRVSPSDLGRRYATSLRIWFDVWVERLPPRRGTSRLG